MSRTSTVRVLGQVLTVVLALTPVAMLSAPAHSASSTTISGKDGVRYDSCRDYPYTYTIDTTAGWSDWDADITLFDPEGSQNNSDYLYDGGDPATGRGTFFICSFEPAGRWRLTIKVTYYNSSYNQAATGSASDTFVLRKPKTKTTYTVSDTTPSRGQVIRVRVTSKIERPAGFFANRYADVALEARRNGAWSRIKGTKTFTGDNGVGTLRVRKTSRGRVSVRAVTFGTTDFAKSVSAARAIR